MSRVIVKNLPRDIKESRIKELFEKHGEITQIKILGQRRFGFVGFLNEKSALAAVRYLNGSYIDTSKLEVALAQHVGAEELPRPWSKFSEGSSAFKKRQEVMFENAARKNEDKKAAEAKKELNAQALKQAEKAKKFLSGIYEVEEKIEKDPKLAEFLEVAGAGSKKSQFWANEEGMANQPVKQKVSLKAEAVPNKKPGGEGLTVVKTHLKFEDSDEEYQELDKKDEEEEAASSEDPEEEESMADDESKPAMNTSLSDLEYFRLKQQEAEKEERSMIEEEKTPLQNSTSKSIEKDLNDKKKKNKEKAVSSDEQNDADDENEDGGMKREDDEDGDEKEDSASGNGAFQRASKYTVRLRGLPFDATEKEISEFLHPLVPLAIRLPLDRQSRPSGKAYVDLKDERDLNEALRRHKDRLGGRYVEVETESDVMSEGLKSKHGTHRSAEVEKKQYPEISGVNVAETGRLFVRNLAFACTEDDLRALFEKYGSLSEVFIPLDSQSKRSKAIGYVTFLSPEHAVAAFTELDGKYFQGRILHILPATTKKDYEVVSVAKSSFKKAQEEQRAKMAQDSFNWNTLFLRQDTVASAMSSAYGISKGDMLNPKEGDGLAVRVALGETHIIAENKEFLRKQGVLLNEFDTKVQERSKSVILVKNLPYETNSDELRGMFAKCGQLGRFIVPPSRTMALVEFLEPSEARAAFKQLAYRKYKHEPLYLEWAPQNTFARSFKEASENPEQESDKEEEEAKGSHPVGGDVAEPASESGACLFVKNLSFGTSEEALWNFFATVGPVRSVKIAKKKNPKGADMLSLGFGFVEYFTRDDAKEAMKTLQEKVLDEHKLLLKFSEKKLTTSENEKGGAVAVKGSKLLVRNLAFEATKRDIQTLFSTFGQLKTVRIPKKFDGNHRGFAFVEFLTKQEAMNAFQALSGSTHLYGRRLVLEWANEGESLDDLREKTERSLVHESSGPRKKFKLSSKGDDDSSF